MDESQLAALYQQYLGRAPDPSGIATWSGQDPAAVIAGIQGSQEYANNQANQGGGGGGGGGGGSSPPMYQDSSGNMVEEINTPVPYDEQVASLLQMGTPANQIQGLIGTKENFNQNLKAQAQEIYERTGNLPSYAESAGFVPGPPSWLNPQHYVSQGYAAPYTQEQITGAVDPSNYRTMNGQLYASAKGPADLSGGEYLINPNTGRFALDASGNPIGVTYPREKPGTFESIMETAIPLFIAAASVPVLGGMGAELASGFGALETAGASGLPGGGPFIPSPGSGANFLIDPSAAYTAATGGFGALETAGAYGLPGGGPFTPSAGSGANFLIDPNAAYTAATGAGGLTLAQALSGLKTGASLLGTGSTIASLANQLTGGSGTTANRSALNPYGANYGSGSGSGGSGYDTGIANLTAGLTQGNQNYSLSGMPTIDETSNPMYAANFQQQAPIRAATGGSTTAILDKEGNYNYNNMGGEDYQSLKPQLTKAKYNYAISGLPGNLIQKKKAGGLIDAPEFYSEGGASMANRYVKGKGDGTSDSIPAMLANGEFVIPADIVSNLGNGSNDSGAKVLDEFLKVIRKHKQKHDTSRLPPNSKGPLAYLTDAKRKVKA